MNKLKVFGEGTIWKVDAEGNQASEKITSRNIILDRGLVEMANRRWSAYHDVYNTSGNGFFRFGHMGVGASSNFIHDPSATVTSQSVVDQKTVIEISNFAEEDLAIETREFWVIVFEGGEVAKIISIDSAENKITLSRELGDNVLTQRYTLWNVRRNGLENQVQTTTTRFSGPSTSGSGNTAQIRTTYEFDAWAGADNTLITEAAVSHGFSSNCVCRVVFGTPTILNGGEKIRFEYTLHLSFDNSQEIIPINISGWGEHEGSYLGSHALLEDLEIAHPSPSPSDYAYVDGVLMRYYDSSWTTSGAHLPLYAETSNPRPNPLNNSGASPWGSKQIYLSSAQGVISFSPTAGGTTPGSGLSGGAHSVGGTALTPDSDSSILECVKTVVTTFDTLEAVGSVASITYASAGCYLRLQEQDLPNNPLGFRPTAREKLNTHRLTLSFSTYWSTAFPNLPN